MRQRLVAPRGWPCWALLGAALGAALGGTGRVGSHAVRCCGCWNSTEDGVLLELEVECRCAGQEMLAIPADLDRAVQRLTIEEAGMTVLRKDSFWPYSNTLRDIVLMELPGLRVIEAGAFAGLPLLRAIYITRAASLEVLPPGVFSNLSGNLDTLRIVHTGLLHVPDLSHLGTGAIMHMIDLEGNNIRAVYSNALHVKAELLLLDYNDIEFVEGWAFNGSEIAKLSLKGNRVLKKLSPNAFHGLRSLRDLDLSETAITELPTAGLEELEVLRIQDTDTLKVIPSVYSFKHLQEAWLTYSFHCCAFKFPARHDPARHTLHQTYLSKVREMCENSEMLRDSQGRLLGRRSAKWDADDIADPSIVTRAPIQHHNHFEAFQPDPNSMFHPRVESGREFRTGNRSGQRGRALFAEAPLVREEKTLRPSKLLPTLAPADGGVFHQTTAAVPPQQLQALCGNLSRSPAPDVLCYPAPDAFNPCEDIMGTPWLRVAVWFVVVTAVLGNLAVILVLASSIIQMTVPKFLMCNLAFADLCMGTYLLLIAAMDLHSIGVYFNFALDWQKGLGCKVAGFITVFASQLSVFTLSILTVERWIAITYAMNLNKRLSLRVSIHSMAVGWTYSITMAALPLFGISGYSKTSICLPMETSDLADVTYLIFLLVVNGLAFLLILVCYVQIYLSLDRNTRRGMSSGTPGGAGAVTGEMSIAKKMALLVFTDLACWAPIAFFGLTAVAGYPLIDVTRSKILLVFFYPLNSCANPFLYTILTSQYRRDLLLILSRHGMCVRQAQQYKVEAVYSAGPVRSSSSLHQAQRQVPEATSKLPVTDVPVQAVMSVRTNSGNKPSRREMRCVLRHGSSCTECVIVEEQQDTFL